MPPAVRRSALQGVAKLKGEESRMPTETEKGRRPRWPFNVGRRDRSTRMAIRPEGLTYGRPASIRPEGLHYVSLVRVATEC